MKTRLSLFILVLAFALFSAVSALAIEGTVIKQDGDRYIIETDEGYSMAIFRDGYAPEVGDVLMGALNKKGVHTIYNVSADEEVVMNISSPKQARSDTNQPATISINITMNSDGSSDYQMSGGNDNSEYASYKHPSKNKKHKHHHDD